MKISIITIFLALILIPLPPAEAEVTESVDGWTSDNAQARMDIAHSSSGALTFKDRPDGMDWGASAKKFFGLVDSKSLGYLFIDVGQVSQRLQINLVSESEGSSKIPLFEMSLINTDQLGPQMVALRDKGIPTGRRKISVKMITYGQGSAVTLNSFSFIPPIESAEGWTSTGGEIKYSAEAALSLTRSAQKRSEMTLSKSFSPLPADSPSYFVFDITHCRKTVTLWAENPKRHKIISVNKPGPVAIKVPARLGKEKNLQFKWVFRSKGDFSLAAAQLFSGIGERRGLK